jgi:pyruvate dehydrogenase E1 component alpha subunit
MAQTTTLAKSLGKEKLEDMYMKMLHTRNFEEKVAYFFSRGMVHGTTHLYAGEEATAVGVMGPMKEEDLMTSTHRGHGHLISKGADLNRMMAELLGKEPGYCKGKGGSMHIADVEVGNLGANGIVGGGIPIATGAGITTKMKGIDRVVVSFFGDGALNEGVFHESLNLASIWDLPVVFVCENNQYAMSYSRKKAFKIDDLSKRAEAYGIPGKTVDGNDVFDVYETAQWARDYVRENGPALIIAETYRYKGHSKSDANRYRTKEEIEEWKKHDPIPRMRSVLEDEKIFTKKELDQMEKQASDDIEAAVEFAQNAPEPSLDLLTTDVYA